MAEKNKKKKIRGGINRGRKKILPRARMLERECTMRGSSQIRRRCSAEMEMEAEERVEMEAEEGDEERETTEGGREKE